MGKKREKRNRLKEDVINNEDIKQIKLPSRRDGSFI